MRRTFLRAVIACYPAEWRRRYGPEVEQFTLDAWSDPGLSAHSTMRMLAGLGAFALVEHWRIAARRPLEVFGTALMAVVIVGAATAALSGGGHGLRESLPGPHNNLADSNLGQGVADVDGSTRLAIAGPVSAVLTSSTRVLTAYTVNGELHALADDDVDSTGLSHLRATAG